MRSWASSPTSWSSVAGGSQSQLCQVLVLGTTPRKVSMGVSFSHYDIMFLLPTIVLRAAPTFLCRLSLDLNHSNSSLWAEGRPHSS